MIWHSRRVSNRREAFITFQPSDFSCAAWTFVPVWNTTLSAGVCVDQEDVGAALCPYKSTSPAQNGAPAAPGSIFTSSGSPDAFVWPVYRLTSINCLMAPCCTALRPPPSTLKWASQPVSPPWSIHTAVEPETGRVESSQDRRRVNGGADRSCAELHLEPHGSQRSVSCFCLQCVCVYVRDSAGNLAPIKPSKLVLYCRSLTCCFFIHLLTGFNRSHRFILLH